MGKAKRRKKLESRFKKPVKVKVEKSSLTGKWLVVAYILGKRTVITPHYNFEDAEAASEQVFQRFNSIPIDEWRPYMMGDQTPLRKAIKLLDYDDDDEIIGVIRGDLPLIDGHPVRDQSKSTISEATKYANQRSIEETGRPLFKSAPGSWIEIKDND